MTTTGVERKSLENWSLNSSMKDETHIRQSPKESIPGVGNLWVWGRIGHYQTFRGPYPYVFNFLFSD